MTAKKTATETPAVVTESGAVVHQPNQAPAVAGSQRLNDAQLSAIGSFADALAAIGVESLEQVERAADYGTGFVVTDKADLVDRLFLVLDWNFRAGDHGDYVSMECVTAEGAKVVINDGSSGLRDQMIRITEARRAARHETPQRGLIAQNGLSAGHYWFHSESGKTSTTRPEGKGWAPATTYRLAGV